MTIRSHGPVAPILLYHSLTSTATPAYRPFAVDPGRFREQMEVIAAAGYRTVTVTELASALDAGSPAGLDRVVAVTFDDGFEEVHSLALPILDRLGLRATVFLVSGYLGATSAWLRRDGEGDRRIVDHSQVRELAAHGFEIGSHSHRHRELDTLGPTELREELRRSKAILEDTLGAPVTSLAYPYGYHSASVKRAAVAADYAVACGVKHALSHTADDRLGLGRVVIYSDTPPERFVELLAGVDLPRSWPKERWQTVLWRTARRAASRIGLRAVGAPPPPAP